MKAVDAFVSGGRRDVVRLLGVVFFELVEQFFEEIRVCLENNEQVKLSGFGNFDLRDKRQRPGRNPKTGEAIPISARRVVTFRPGQKLKARVEQVTDVGGFDDA